MSKNTEKVKRSWFFIILLAFTSLSLAGTAAYFSIFGLSKLFYGAGIGIIILATVLEISKLVTVSYVYRYWKHIAKALRVYYILGIIFIMLLTSIGIYGFLTSAYQNTANKVEMRDSQINIADNKKKLFTAQLDRLNDVIENNNNRINSLSTARNQQESRLNNLYTGNKINSAKRTEGQITSSDKQIENLNSDITAKMTQSNAINDSIAFYDQRIVELRSSDVSNEVGPLKYLSDLTGASMNKVVNILVLLIIFVFDPMAITLLIGVNQLIMMGDTKPTEDTKIELPLINQKKKKEDEDEDDENNIIKKNESPINVKSNAVEKLIQKENKNFLENNSELTIFTDQIDDESDEENMKDDVIETLDTQQDEEILSDLKKNENSIQNCQVGYTLEKKIVDFDEITIGMTINHDTFGDGVVSKLDKEKRRIFIKFDNGIRELDPDYANLKKYEYVKIEQNDEPEAMKYLDFFTEDLEYKDMVQQLVPKESFQPDIDTIDENSIDTEFKEEEGTIIEPSPVKEETIIEPSPVKQEETIVPSIIEEKLPNNVSEKKTRFFHKIWKGKKIV